MVDSAAIRRLLDRQSEAIDGLDNTEMRRMLRIYEATRLELSDALLQMQEHGLDEATPFTYQRYQATIVQVEAAVKRMRGRLNDTMAAATTAEGERSIADLVAVLSRTEQGFTGVASAIETHAVRRLSEVNGLLLHQHSLDRYTAETIEAIQRELLIGVTRKQSYRDLRRRLFGVQHRNAYESVWLQREHRLKLIVQMERAKVSDEVHRASLDEAAKVLDVENDPDPLLARADEYRDNRNHPLSPALHGRLRKLDEDWSVPRIEVEAWQAVTKYKGPPSSIVWSLEDGAYVGRTYPAHFGDRGRQTAWRRSWGDAGELGEPELPAGSEVRPTRPVLPPDAKRKPTGASKPQLKRTTERGRGWGHENDAAKKLAELGFRVEQLPEVQKDHGGNQVAGADYRVNGRPMDHLAPTTSQPSQVRKAISYKVRKQAPRVLVNMVDLKMVSMEDITTALQRNPVPGLLELFALDGDKLYELVDGTWRRVV